MSNFYEDTGFSGGMDTSASMRKFQVSLIIKQDQSRYGLLSLLSKTEISQPSQTSGGNITPSRQTGGY